MIMRSQRLLPRRGMATTKPIKPQEGPKVIVAQTVSQIHLRNRSPTKTVHDMTLYQAWMKMKWDMCCPCPRPQRRKKKAQSQGKEYIFLLDVGRRLRAIGYMIWLVWRSSTARMWCSWSESVMQKVIPLSLELSSMSNYPTNHLVNQTQKTPYQPKHS